MTPSSMAARPSNYAKISPLRAPLIACSSTRVKVAGWWSVNLYAMPYVAGVSVQYGTDLATSYVSLGMNLMRIMAGKMLGTRGIFGMPCAMMPRCRCQSLECVVLLNHGVIFVT